MAVCAVLTSMIPILWALGIGSEVMKPIARPEVPAASKVFEA
jgi:Cu/Ag efflux pump CusA